MANDPLEKLLDLEDGFYEEGYQAGVADSAYAGMIEGKVFGIEKGYQKAVELGKLHGRALVWEARSADINASKATSEKPSDQGRSVNEKFGLDNLPKNSRLSRHVQSLLELTKDVDVNDGNSDEAVAAFDDRISKAQAKAKLVANITGEQMHPSSVSTKGIEDATGLQARN